MHVIVDFSIDADEFVLGRCFDRDERLAAEVLELVASGERVTTLLRVPETTADRLCNAVSDRSEVTRATSLTTTGRRTLIRVDWDRRADTLPTHLTETNGVVLEAYADETRWTFRVRFPERVSLRRFERRCSESNIDLAVYTHYDPSLPAVVESRLTASQRETLAAAYAQGYFDIPRDVSLRELSAEFGISEQAASQRIRRGLSNTLAALRFDEGGESDGDE